jgi:hypothetical protein
MQGKTCYNNNKIPLFYFIFKIEKSEDICVYDFQVFFNSADFDDQV